MQSSAGRSTPAAATPPRERRRQPRPAGTAIALACPAADEISREAVRAARVATGGAARAEAQVRAGSGGGGGRRAGAGAQVRAGSGGVRRRRRRGCGRREPTGAGPFRRPEASRLAGPRSGDGARATSAPAGRDPWVGALPPSGIRDVMVRARSVVTGHVTRLRTPRERV